MIDRKELKNRAKNAFKGKYWYVFAACAVFLVLVLRLGGSVSSGPNLTLNGFNAVSDVNDEVIIQEGDYYYDITGDGEIYIDEFSYLDAELPDALFYFLAALGVILLIVVLWAVIVSFVRNIFIINPLKIGLKTYFLNNRDNKAHFKDLFKGFTNGNYKNTVGTLFTTDLFIWLWSLLFIIPGIYHSYVYYLVPFICAERPDISASEARRLSRVLTDGYKADIFVLELSFIGWRLLGSLLVIGTYFVEPYFQATYAELYAELRERAIASGKIRPEDVGLVSAVDDPFEFVPESFETVEN